jgi:predicted Holliday junction resolvase-like endonuclease
MDAQAAVIETANYAAMQSDRWLFVALLVIGLLAIGVLFKFFTGKLDSLQERMDKQNEDFISHLRTSNKEMLEVISLAQATISKNSILMERIEKKLDSI